MSRSEPRARTAPELAVACAMACAVVLVASCGITPVESADPVAAASPARPTPVTSRLAQLEYGARALFGWCTPPGCPTPTPKTLPAAAAPTLAAAAQPTAPIPRPMVAATNPGSITGPLDPYDAVVPIPPRTVTTILTFTFPPGGSTLDARAQAALVVAMTDHADAASIRVVGRTDSTGSAAGNQTLAMARAQSMRDFLRRLYPRVTEVVITDTRGACCYAAPNDTAVGRSQNRRVELHVDQIAEPAL